MGEASVTFNWPTVTNDKFSGNDRMPREERGEGGGGRVGPEARGENTKWTRRRFGIHQILNCLRVKEEIVDERDNEREK